MQLQICVTFFLVSGVVPPCRRRGRGGRGGIENRLTDYQKKKNFKFLAMVS